MMAIVSFLDDHSATLLFGAAVVMVCGLAAEGIRQLLDDDDRDPEKRQP